ncbi:S1/P1 nuclease [Aspergillus floccosus]
MFLFHFFGDLHMPLHVEGYAQGGTKVNVTFDGHTDHLHSIWDTDMPHKINGIKHRLKRNEEKEPSLKWAKHLIQQNKHRPTTAECTDITNPQTCLKPWAEETNRLNCAVVFKRGIPYLTGEDLAGEYYDDAVPIIEEQIYKAGIRLAAWMDAIAEERRSKSAFVIQGDRMRDL